MEDIPLIPFIFINALSFALRYSCTLHTPVHTYVYYGAYLHYQDISLLRWYGTIAQEH